MARGSKVTKVHFDGNRLGYLLSEEETEKVVAIMDYMDKPPHEFVSHCIEVLWNRMDKDEG